MGGTHSRGLLGPASRGFSAWAMIVLGLVAMLMVAGLAGCSQKADDSGTGSADKGTAASESDAAAPEDANWIVYINDEQTQQQGGMTYGIAMNLTAKNTSGGPAGTYTGEATAKTTTTGDVGGATLDASAIAKSTQLEFSLTGSNASEVESESAGALAPLTEGDYSGSGTITMQASGSGTVGAAGGTFGNTSGQSFTITVTGTQAVMKININGMEWTFTGVLRSEPK